MCVVGVLACIMLKIISFSPPLSMHWHDAVTFSWHLFMHSWKTCTFQLADLNKRIHLAVFLFYSALCDLANSPVVYAFLVYTPSAMCDHMCMCGVVHACVCGGWCCHVHPCMPQSDMKNGCRPALTPSIYLSRSLQLSHPRLEAA